jgi:hypothetical protein
MSLNIRTLVENILRVSEWKPERQEGTNVRGGPHRPSVETHTSGSDPFRSLGHTLTGVAACVCQEWLKVWSETVCMESGQEKVVVSGMVWCLAVQQRRPRTSRAGCEGTDPWPQACICDFTDSCTLTRARLTRWWLCLTREVESARSWGECGCESRRFHFEGCIRSGLT